MLLFYNHGARETNENICLKIHSDENTAWFCFLQIFSHSSPNSLVSNILQSTFFGKDGLTMFSDAFATSVAFQDSNYGASPLLTVQ